MRAHPRPRTCTVSGRWSSRWSLASAVRGRAAAGAPTASPSSSRVTSKRVGEGPQDEGEGKIKQDNRGEGREDERASRLSVCGNASHTKRRFFQRAMERASGVRRTRGGGDAAGFASVKLRRDGRADSHPRHRPRARGRPPKARRAIARTPPPPAPHRPLSPFRGRRPRRRRRLRPTRHRCRRPRARSTPTPCR